MDEDDAGASPSAPPRPSTPARRRFTTSPPVPADVLAAREVGRRNALGKMGPCRSGCGDLDDHVLRGGGFERGCVVGLGLQVLSRELLDRRASSPPDSRALIITPRPAGEVLGSLRESLEAQLRQTGEGEGEGEGAGGCVLAECLERVMLSCVFDMDGLGEVLSDLDRDVQDAEAEADIHETHDGQDARGGEPPSLVLITHFSSLLSGLFAQRERRAAHETVSRVGARLGRLSRTLPSGPLVMMLNSATGTGTGTGPPTRTAADPSLQGIFGPRPRPSFGVVFAQLLDMHLLCSRATTRHGGTPTETVRRRDGGQEQDHPGAASVTVVEVLTDDMGVWQGRRGPRPSREQRWTAVHVVAGRVVCAMHPG
ncbi:hypothetical protein E4U42_002196 [Claviceps africana]|uniref:Uncharacterized protein n=1 Tax=Claviceps africana TaxID=83212 RepID=A0A8K0J8K1_9HYPO|nr:hypothetical protein E4U42_002196 [Claviceps africana]